MRYVVKLVKHFDSCRRILSVLTSTPSPDVPVDGAIVLCKQQKYTIMPPDPLAMPAATHDLASSACWAVPVSSPLKCSSYSITP